MGRSDLAGLVGLTLGLLVATESVATTVSQAALEAFQRPTSIPFPADNPFTPNKAALGKALYFEPRLSSGQNLNCASCHNPSFGWEVPVAGAIGSQNTPLGRRAPTVLNHAWGEHFFWDGRAATLEEQARGPIEADVEMNLPMAEAVRRLAAIDGYRTWFEDVFPGEGVTETTILQAIATFERTVVSGQAPFDRWVAGDAAAVSAAARRGFELFTGKAGCAGCHTGWNFSDDRFHDIGVPTDDEGRFDITRNPRDRFAFKTPGLRDLTLRGPFMHNGAFPDVEATLWFYASGGIERPSRSALIRPFTMSEDELRDLVAFLESLTAEAQTVALPVLPR